MIQITLEHNNIRAVANYNLAEESFLQNSRLMKKYSLSLEGLIIEESPKGIDVKECVPERVVLAFESSCKDISLVERTIKNMFLDEIQNLYKKSKNLYF